MALLDVSEVIADPLFTSPVTLIARSLSYDEDGNPEWIDEESEQVQAVVTSDLKSIERLSDALRREGTILVRVLAKSLPYGFVGGGYDVANRIVFIQNESVRRVNFAFEGFRDRAIRKDFHAARL